MLIFAKVNRSSALMRNDLKRTRKSFCRYGACSISFSRRKKIADLDKRNDRSPPTLLIDDRIIPNSAFSKSL